MTAHVYEDLLGLIKHIEPGVVMSVSDARELWANNVEEMKLGFANTLKYDFEMDDDRFNQYGLIHKHYETNSSSHWATLISDHGKLMAWMAFCDGIYAFEESGGSLSERRDAALDAFYQDLIKQMCVTSQFMTTSDIVIHHIKKVASILASLVD